MDKIFTLFWLLGFSWCCDFSKMIDRNYFAVISASILSILGYILPGLINLSISTLYGWPLTQHFFAISSSLFPLFLLLDVRHVGLRTEVNEATIWVLVVVFVTDLPVPIDFSSLSSLHFYFTLHLQISFMLLFTSLISLRHNRVSSLFPALLYAHLIFLCCHFGDSTFCHPSVFSVSENLSKPICPTRQTSEWSLCTISWAYWDLLFSRALFSPFLPQPQDLKLSKLVMTTLPKPTFISKCLNKYVLLVYSCSCRAPLLPNKYLLGLVLEVDISAFQKSVLLLQCWSSFQQLSCWSHC